jgi:hypothetical protein
VRLRLHPEAEEELFRDAAWYDDRRDGLGDEFLDDVYRWFDAILESPELWPRWPEIPVSIHPVIRRVVVERFPYSIAYQLGAEEIVVLAVAPAKRSPFYWMARAEPSTQR